MHQLLAKQVFDQTVLLKMSFYSFYIVSSISVLPAGLL